MKVPKLSRREQIVALAWSIRLVEPGCETATGRIQRRGLVVRRFDANKFVPCGKCSEPGETLKGSGWYVDPYRRKFPCDECGGYTDESGKHFAGSGKVAYDRMDKEEKLRKVTRGSSPGDDVATTPTRVFTRKCLGCNGEGWHGNEQMCRDCGGAGQIEFTRFQLHLPPDGDAPASDAEEFMIDQITRYQRGGWHDLEQALWALTNVPKPLPRFAALADPAEAARAKRLFDSVFRVHTLDEAALNPRERELLDAAVDFIDFRMPADYVIPKDIVEAWVHRDDEGRQPYRYSPTNSNRDALMLTRAEAGETNKELALVFELSESGVEKALARARKAKEQK